MALLRKLANNASEEDDDIKSIIENINTLLNTKRGYSSFLQDFGLSDYHHLSSCMDIAKLIMDEMTDNIARFEPRLEHVTIVATADDSMSRLTFRLDGVLRVNQQPLKLFLEPIGNAYKVKP